MQNDSANSTDNLKIAAFWENAPLIHNDAIFIADTHFMPLESPINEKSKNASVALLEYFENILAKPKSIASQIFLMGDIAHLLLGGVDSSYKSNQHLISLIESLSLHSQIWWFEGNHDFSLNAFKKPFCELIRIIPRDKQPKAFCFNHNGETKHLLLAHGDLFLNTKYELYTRFMRTRFTGVAMRLLDSVTFGNLYNYIIAKVNQNTIRIGKADMPTFAPTRIQAYQKYMQESLELADSNASIFDVIIEGHFHIGDTYSDKILYVSLPSFYINGSIFAIQSLFNKSYEESN